MSSHSTQSFHSNGDYNYRSRNYKQDERQWPASGRDPVNRHSDRRERHFAPYETPQNAIHESRQQQLPPQQTMQQQKPLSPQSLIYQLQQQQIPPPPSHQQPKEFAAQNGYIALSLSIEKTKKEIGVLRETFQRDVSQIDSAITNLANRVAQLFVMVENNASAIAIMKMESEQAAKAAAADYTGYSQ